jgi:2-polyprenyl-6-methoxyphenol hydroxylase-like FAD-dependent oxidoreductase
MPVDVLQNRGQALKVEILVIGAGLAGASAATVLARAGHTVALVDIHPLHPPEFRTEKLSAQHMALFEKLRLADTILPLTTPMDDIQIYRFGRLFSREQRPEYGFHYSDLVNGLRQAVPPQVRTIVAKVTELATGPVEQHVHLSTGDVIEARLVVIATGLGNAVRRLIGGRRVKDAKAHSLAIGFDLAGKADSFPFRALTYYGRRAKDRLAYLTLFPIGDTMRANLFVYRAASEPWSDAFRDNPGSVLRQLMPEIAAQCGNFHIDGKVTLRPIDLTSSEGHERDGVVVIGDAYCTTCPVPGVGILRAMTDVDRLCNIHIPLWLSTPGMGRRKIARFYDDEVKTATDRNAIRASYHAKSIGTEMGPKWQLLRFRNNCARWLQLIARRAGLTR